MTSPTGHTWYNFYPADYLTWPLDHGDLVTLYIWSDVAFFLWLGQLYE